MVTGAAGFIGSHLVERLLDSGVQVRALIRYTSRGARGWWDDKPAVASQIEFVLGDVRDPRTVERAVRGCDTVFHLAALIGIPYSYETPEAYVGTNIDGTLNVLEASRRFDVGRTIVTSTSEVYGTAQFVPITESHPIRPQSPYAATKAAADHLAGAYNLSFGTPIVIVRPFNTYGPRQSLRAVIPTIIAQLLQGKRVRLGATDTSRDFTFVTDTARGMVLAATASGVEGRTIQLGTGTEISIRDLAQRIARLLGVDPQIELDAQRLRPDTSEVGRLVADATHARELLGWTPTMSLDDGLTTTIEWMRRSNEKALVAMYNT